MKGWCGVSGNHFDGANRDRLLRSLGGRIEGHLRNGDVRGVTIDDAVSEARALIELVRNSPDDLEVHMTVAHLYWSRVEVARRTGADASESEVRTALAHFSAVHDEYPHHIPDEVREFLDYVQGMKGRASDLIDQAALPEGRRALNEAIEIIREVVGMLGDEDPTLPIPLSELAVALDNRYKLTDHAEDIAEAVEVIDRAISLTHPDDDEAPRRQQLRKWMLVTRYDHAGDMADLEEAIRLGHEIMDNASTNSPDLATMMLDFISLYWRRYKGTQAIADLDAGIRYGREGLLTDPSESPARASNMDDLAVLLRHRGSRSGRAADLEEAVRLSRRAVAEFPAEHFDWTGICSGLSESLRLAGTATRDSAMLREAVTFAVDVVRVATERDHPGVAGFTQNVGVCYAALAEIDPDISHLATAVEYLRVSVEGLANGPLARAARSDLGNSLAALGEKSGDPSLLDEAIAQHREAVGDSIDDPATALLRSNLAVGLRKRYLRDQAVEDRAQAVELFRSVARLETISTPLRLVGARSWGQLEVDAKNWDAASHALGLAVDLLTQVSAPNLARGDQERQLMGEPGLVAEAVAAALEIGDLDRAAELFEQGRGVLTSHALDLRTDVGRLADEDPTLADTFVRLRDSLDGDSPDQDSRHLWANQWHGLLRTIRARPGFESFLLPMSAEQIRAAAADGPIVMVNVSNHRSDALVVRRDTITLVPLPFTRESMVHNSFAFVAALEMLLDTASLSVAQAERANGLTRDALRWAWRAVAGPVVSHLGFDDLPDPGRRPRLWWMPSALLNFLPLHAAFTEDEFGQQTSVLDLVVCSYTPTVKSLVRTKTRVASAGEAAGPLVVGMAETPGYGPLPGVLDEARFIQDEFPGTVCMINEQATRTAVLDRIRDHPWVHVSCHGHSDRTNPSASYLLVAEAAELSVLEIAQQRIDGEFAFLSACSTGASGLALADESVHLAGAFQLAGYSHVIAAMWPIFDDVALEIARHVYSLVSPRTSSVNHSAAILHSAVRKIQADYPDEPMLWASFVHIGP